MSRPQARCLELWAAPVRGSELERVQGSTVADDQVPLQRHLLAALDQALRHPGEVIDVLSGVEDDEAGYAALHERFGWDEIRPARSLES